MTREGIKYYTYTYTCKVLFKSGYYTHTTTTQRTWDIYLILGHGGDVSYFIRTTGDVNTHSMRNYFFVSPFLSRLMDGAQR